MTLDQLNQLAVFCNDMDTAKLEALVNDAGFVAARNSMLFEDVDSIAIKGDTATVHVSFTDRDRMSDSYNEVGQVHFEWSSQRVTNLDFVQKFC